MEKGINAQGGHQALLEGSGGGMWDLVLVGLVILAAAFYLYRKLWLKRGACSGCASAKAGCATSCSTDFDVTAPLEQPAGEKK